MHRCEADGDDHSRISEKKSALRPGDNVRRRDGRCGYLRKTLTTKDTKGHEGKLSLKSPVLGSFVHLSVLGG